jgi:hypothetical protein
MVQENGSHMHRILAAALVASVTLAAPASAVTVLFGGTTANVNSLSGSIEGIDWTLTAVRFTATPSTLTSFSQFGAALQLRRTAPGVGVNGGGSADQVDTNQPNRREAFIFSTSVPIEIAGLKLSYVDADDTLLFFGVKDNGDLVPLINDGTIRSGLAGAAAVVNQNSLNSGTSTLTFPSPWGYFDRYVLTTRVGGDVMYANGLGQGYRLDALSVNIVPEPATWALLITGFAMVGVSARRRRPHSA